MANALPEASMSFRAQFCHGETYPFDAEYVILPLL